MTGKPATNFSGQDLSALSRKLSTSALRGFWLSITSIKPGESDCGVFCFGLVIET